MSETPAYFKSAGTLIQFYADRITEGQEFPREAPADWKYFSEVPADEWADPYFEEIPEAERRPLYASKPNGEKYAFRCAMGCWGIIPRMIHDFPTEEGPLDHEVAMVGWEDFLSNDIGEIVKALDKAWAEYHAPPVSIKLRNLGALDVSPTKSPPGISIVTAWRFDAWTSHTPDGSEYDTMTEYLGVVDMSKLLPRWQENSGEPVPSGSL